MAKKEVVSDFRYNTGESQVPWAAVGENVREEEILSMVNFLIRPADKKAKEYKAKLDRVKAGALLEVPNFRSGKITKE